MEPIEDYENEGCSLGSHDYHCNGVCYANCVNQKDNKCLIYTGHGSCDGCRCIIGCNY